MKLCCFFIYWGKSLEPDAVRNSKLKPCLDGAQQDDSYSSLRKVLNTYIRSTPELITQTKNGHIRQEESTKVRHHFRNDKDCFTRSLIFYCIFPKRVISETLLSNTINRFDWWSWSISLASVYTMCLQPWKSESRAVGKSVQNTLSERRDFAWWTVVKKSISVTTSNVKVLISISFIYSGRSHWD